MDSINRSRYNTRATLRHAFVGAVLAHFGAVALFAHYFRPKPPPAQVVEERSVLIDFSTAEEPVPPAEEPPAEEPANNEPAAAEALAASLPEPPAALLLGDAITQVVSIRPAVPPRPAGLDSFNLPSRSNRAGGDGTGTGLRNVFDVVDLDRAPQVRIQTAPTYPWELRRAGVEGVATVRLLIDPNGLVAEAEPIQATHPDFGEAAAEAARKWRFTPGIKGGQKVFVRAVIPIRFEITAAN